MEYEEDLSLLFDDLDNIKLRLKHFICRSLEDWNSNLRIKYKLYNEDNPPLHYEDLSKHITNDVKDAFSDVCFMSKGTFEKLLKNPLYAIRNTINLAKICRVNNYHFPNELSHILYGYEFDSKNKSKPLFERLIMEIQEKTNEKTRIDFVNLVRFHLSQNSLNFMIDELKKVTKKNNTV